MITVSATLWLMILLDHCNSVTGSLYSPHIWERGILFRFLTLSRLMAKYRKDRLCLGRRRSPVMFHVTDSTQYRPWTRVSTLFVIVCIRPHETFLHVSKLIVPTDSLHRSLLGCVGLSMAISMTNYW